MAARHTSSSRRQASSMTWIFRSSRDDWLSSVGKSILRACAPRTLGPKPASFAFDGLPVHEVLSEGNLVLGGFANPSGISAADFYAALFSADDAFLPTYDFADGGVLTPLRTCRPRHHASSGPRTVTLGNDAHRLRRPRLCPLSPATETLGRSEYLRASLTPGKKRPREIARPRVQSLAADQPTSSSSRRPKARAATDQLFGAAGAAGAVRIWCMWWAEALARCAAVLPLRRRWR